MENITVVSLMVGLKWGNSYIEGGGGGVIKLHGAL